MIWRWGKGNIPVTEAVLEAARGHFRDREILALIAERWDRDALLGVAGDWL